MKRIYFIKPVGIDGPIKIGCSDAPDRRLADLGSWSPWPLELIGAVPGVIRDESFLHTCFADLHSHHEWFRSAPRLRDAIGKVLAAGTVSILADELKPVGSIRSAHQRKRSPTHNRIQSYRHRIRWAERKLRQTGGEDAAWYAPADVHSITNAWHSTRPPTAEQFARIDEYLANPAAYSVVPPWRKPAQAATQ